MSGMVGKVVGERFDRRSVGGFVSMPTPGWKGVDGKSTRGAIAPRRKCRNWVEANHQKRQRVGSNCKQKRSKLLNAREETELAAAVARSLEILSARELLVECLQREPSLEEWGKQASVLPGQIVTALEDGQRAKDVLVETNLGLVVSIAGRYGNQGVSIQDLVQEGAMGLIRAAEKFDASKGARFTSYATFWVQHFIRKAICDDSSTIRLPRSFRDKLKHVKRAYKNIFDNYGRVPHVEELVRETGFTKETVEKLVVLSREVQSLDQLAFGEDGERSASVGELVEWGGEGPEDITSTQMMRESIQSALRSTLSEQERVIIRLKYGLGAEGEARLVDIARRYEVTSARIRQIELKALNKLRKHSSSLSSYLHDD